jgi:hypothetical protein
LSMRHQSSPHHEHTECPFPWRIPRSNVARASRGRIPRSCWSCRVAKSPQWHCRYRDHQPRPQCHQTRRRRSYPHSAWGVSPLSAQSIVRRPGRPRRARPGKATPQMRERGGSSAELGSCFFFCIVFFVVFFFQFSFDFLVHRGLRSPKK